MKVSELTVEELKAYCRAEDTPEAELLLAAALAAAKGYIKNRNQITDDYMDQHEELTLVVYILVADMYDNRSATVASGMENKTVETILKLHDFNFI